MAEELTKPVRTCQLDTTVPCPVCGFDPRQLLPADAAVAARSLARRWRELLSAIVEREDAGGALLSRRLPSGWSTLEQAAHVAAVFDRHAQLLERVWIRQQPLIDETSTQACHARESTPLLDEALAALASAGETLAGRIQAFDVDDWDRAGTSGEERITALELTHHAIHEGVHHLRVTRDELAPLCKHPLDEAE